ncbi:hypothetical protein E2R51_11645 [Jeotgalibacillus sp. S-D1]|uniref:hypothetical protein n=1 Tax=Jeotgalibacillus sp. S-D1 TaxID=2552189 RepID=UPI0010F35EA8|nr:hypothetical protein [Jeotgalibacillus sp. S-D1]TDL31867.1 hypothetical protein E2R51_11645 [Jeotgalibacillus sp. S-D1]
MVWFQRLSQFFYRYGNVYTLLIALVLFAVFIGVVLPAESEKSAQQTGSSRSPDTALFYQADELYSIAEEYGEEGRSAYVKARYTFDIAWPLAYTFFLTAALSFFLRSMPASRWKLLNLLPAAGMALDFLENTGTSIVMLRFPSETPVIAHITPFFTLFKWLSIYASFGLLVVAFIYWVVYSIKKRRKK